MTRTRPASFTAIPYTAEGQVNSWPEALGRRTHESGRLIECLLYQAIVSEPPLCSCEITEPHRARCLDQYFGPAIFKVMDDVRPVCPAAKPILTG